MWLGWHQPHVDTGSPYSWDPLCTDQREQMSLSRWLICFDIYVLVFAVFHTQPFHSRLMIAPDSRIKTLLFFVFQNNEFISDVFRKWSLAYWPNNSTCWTISMIFNCSRFACSQFRNEFVRHSTVLPLPCVQCSIHNGSILVVSELHKTTKLTLTNPDLFPPSWSTN